jgi:hypothetical protein
MRQARVFVSAVGCLGVALLGPPAHADSFALISNDGPIQLHIEQDGDVHGRYPKLNGTIMGHVSDGGDIEGIWLQPNSEHPCREARNGTYSWGHFVMSSPYQPNMRGAWGYCGEEPQRDWEIGHN